MSETNTDRNRRLTPKLREEICRRLAAYETPTEVVRFLRDEHGIGITESGVSYYAHSDRWRDTFMHHRAAFNSDLLDTRTASKRWRLEQLRIMYDATEAEYVRPDKSPEDTLEVIRTRLAILEQCRRETDLVISDQGKPALGSDQIARALGLALGGLEDHL